MDPEFLDLADVLLIHEEQLARYGGSAGLRDQGLLESAIAMPQATFGGAFVHEDLFAMAAAYAFHITENQPFVGGNKRTGVLAAVVFLGAERVHRGGAPVGMARTPMNAHFRIAVVRRRQGGAAASRLARASRSTRPRRAAHASR